jgi:hypothetical protein
MPVGQRNIRASGASDGLEPIYGEQGLFGVPGVDPVLVNAMVNPLGIDQVLTWVGTDEERPFYDALVYTGSTGSSQSTACGDCGTPSFKECVQTAPLGRFCQQTPEFQFDNIGLKLNRGVPRLALFGNITDPAGNILVPKGQQIRDAFALAVAGVVYHLRTIHGQMLWTGNPTNNTGGYQEFKGFDLLINSGYYDVITGLACSQLDSYLDDYQSNIVGATGAPSILARLRGMIRSIRYRAAGAGLNPDTMETYIVMSPQHWDQVSEAIACEYGIACNTDVVDRQDAREVARQRDEMMNQMVISIDGKQYPVITDNLMSMTTAAYGNSTKFCGDIYAITTTIEGETITWGEYQDFNMTGGQVLADLRRQFDAANIAITDGGKFLHAPTFEGGICFDVRTFTKPRVIMRMPQLSGRIQNVCVAPEGEYPAPTGSGLYGELTGGSSSKPSLYDYGVPFNPNQTVTGQ